MRTLSYNKAKAEQNLTLLLNTSCLDATMSENRIVSIKAWQSNAETFSLHIFDNHQRFVRHFVKWKIKKSALFPYLHMVAKASVCLILKFNKICCISEEKGVV